MQGDITSVVNEKGQTILNYSYDAWGAVTFSATSMQNMMLAYTLSFVSSFTYRGYCYDYDIELYYLQSRYYSPEIGRFINTDDTQIAIATQGEILGTNLFAYCNNNPVINADYTGYINLNALKKESWVVRAVLKYIPSVSYSKTIKKTVYNTPKWLGVYFELSVAVGVQSNPSGLFSYGFSMKSFDVGVSLGTGKTSVAFSIGISWTEIYIQCSIIYSSKIERMFFAVNFRIAMRHWFTLGAAALCYAIPVLTPVAASVAKALISSLKVVSH